MSYEPGPRIVLLCSLIYLGILPNEAVLTFLSSYTNILLIVRYHVLALFVDLNSQGVVLTIIVTLICCVQSLGMPLRTSTSVSFWWRVILLLKFDSFRRRLWFRFMIRGSILIPMIPWSWFIMIIIIIFLLSTSLVLWIRFIPSR